MFRFKPDWARAQSCYEQAGTNAYMCDAIRTSLELSLLIFTAMESHEGNADSDSVCMRAQTQR